MKNENNVDLTEASTPSAIEKSPDTPTMATIGVAPMERLATDSLNHVPVLKRDFKRLKTAITQLPEDARLGEAFWALLGIAFGILIPLLKEVNDIYHDVKTRNLATEYVYPLILFVVFLVCIIPAVTILIKCIKQRKNINLDVTPKNNLNNLITEIEDTFKDKTSST